MKIFILPFLFVVLVGGIFSLCQKREETDPDQQVLDQLKKAGSDLSKPHNIEFFLYFPSEDSANEAAKDIKVEVDELKVQFGAEQKTWLCFATKRMVPKHEELVRLRKTFNQIADKYRGQYDGWGTEVESNPTVRRVAEAWRWVCETPVGMVMSLQLVIAGTLIVTIHVAGYHGSAVAQTVSHRAGCAKQTTQGVRRPCAIDYLPAGLISDDKLLLKPKPIYPEAAKAKGISGSVYVWVVTDIDGNVVSARISSGPPLLQEAAFDAAKRARLPRSKLSGVPIKVGGVLRYDFILERTNRAHSAVR